MRTPPTTTETTATGETPVGPRQAGTPAPPPLCDRPLQPALWLAGLLALVVGVQLLMASGLPAPFCPLRTLSGVPCPLCGSTRALLAFAALEPIAAFRWNPLTALACAGIVATFLVWLAGRGLRRDWLVRTQARSDRLPIWELLAAALVANWIYLCLTLPR